MFEEFTTAAVVDAIGEAARAENRACARRLAAIAELYERRTVPVVDGQGREMWRIDPWEAVAAEVAAAQCITAAAAGALMHNAICLRERLPKVAGLFASGAIDYRMVRMIVARTMLALDQEDIAAIDAELAEKIPGWGPMSVLKLQNAVEAIVVRHDPQARRRSDGRSRSRYVEITHERDASSLSGQLNTADATLLDRRLSALSHTVCGNDPRTVEQRRADAMGALAAGLTRLVCACGESGCPAADEGAASPSVIVHVVVDAAAMNSADGGDLHGERPGDSVEVVTSRERLIELLGPGPADPSPAARGASASGVVLGGSAISASVLADLAARGVAELRPLLHPGIGPAEPRYRPSGALADFIRCRDLTCRFPGCDCPAELCDIDHTVPYGAGGPTHPSNLKLLCRKHHLMKTFWTGTGGWRDEQHPDGTVVWTSPSGHVYRTSPGSALLVPALCVPTGQLEPIAPRRISPDRGVRMPQRKRTRAADRHHRIMRERRCNSGL